MYVLAAGFALTAIIAAWITLSAGYVFWTDDNPAASVFGYTVVGLLITIWSTYAAGHFAGLWL